MRTDRGQGAEVSPRADDAMPDATPDATPDAALDAHACPTTFAYCVT